MAGLVKGTVEHSKSEVAYKKEEDLFETFEDWAVRQITLKRCSDEASAWELFKIQLEKKALPVLFVRDQWLIAKFAGVKMGQVKSDELRAALKASQDLTSRADIDAFTARAAELSDKRSRGVDTSYQNNTVPDRMREVDDSDVYGIFRGTESGDADKVMVKHLTGEMQKKMEAEEAEEKALVAMAEVMNKAKKAKNNQAAAAGAASSSCAGAAAGEGPQTPPAKTPSSKILKLQFETQLVRLEEAHNDAHTDMLSKLNAASTMLQDIDDQMDEGGSIKTSKAEVEEALKAWATRSDQVLAEIKVEAARVTSMESDKQDPMVLAEVAEKTKTLSRDFLSSKVARGAFNNGLKTYTKEMRDIVAAQKKKDEARARVAAKKCKLSPAPLVPQGMKLFAEIRKA